MVASIADWIVGSIGAANHAGSIHDLNRIFPIEPAKPLGL
jgi:hypothetical protein